MAAKSPPAMKPLPSPDKTTARTEESSGNVVTVVKNVLRHTRINGIQRIGPVEAQMSHCAFATQDDLEECRS